MFGRKLIHLLVILFVFAVLKKADRRSLKGSRQRVRENRQVQQNFHEVDALGDDFIDFGAQTGPLGQFSWHADFPLEQ